MFMDTARPRVSRETRRLLAAAGLALVALWILARVRFPDRPPTPNPVAPVLSQIAPPMAFADLAGELERSQHRILPALVQIEGTAHDSRTFPAWPLDGGVALSIFPQRTSAPRDERLVAWDSVTGLALVRASEAKTPSPAAWTPGALDIPRYVIAVTPGRSKPAVAPAYIGALEPRRSPAWPKDVWSVSVADGVVAGAFVFTTRGEWLGIATNEDGHLLIVPAATLLDSAGRIGLAQGPAPGELGIEVQELTPALATATGASQGVVVTWVDARGATEGALVPGDVITHVNGEQVSTTFDWQVRAARLTGGLPVTLRRHRHGELHDVVVQVPPAATSGDNGLGLSLVREAGIGARVVHVAAGSVAERADLKPGDIVTMAGTTPSPTPAQVRRAFDGVSPEGILVVAITRGNQHVLATLTR